MEAVPRIQLWLWLLHKAKAVKANLPFVCVRVTLSEGKAATSLLNSMKNNCLLIPTQETMTSSMSDFLKFAEQFRGIPGSVCFGGM